MPDPAMLLSPHVSFWLDVADKLIKFAAVCLGGVWTWWNFHKSRTYAQKLELQIAGHVFHQGSLYVDVLATLRNVVLRGMTSRRPRTLARSR